MLRHKPREEGTIFFGLLLVTRTRGYVNLFRGEWGAIIISCMVIAVALLGFVLTVLAVGLMTRHYMHRPAQKLQHGAH